MLHILTIAIRQIIHAFALAVQNSQILMRSGIIFQKSLWNLFMLHNKEI